MVASSTIGVAGTVFSITIAALSLAAGQLGPRLLRNFTRDRGVQIALGTFLGTYTFALMVLRAVRDKSEGAFVPHLALSTAIFFALVCVGMLIYFVDRMASRINVDTVIALVGADLRTAFQRLTSEEPCLARPSTIRQPQLASSTGWASRSAISFRGICRPAFTRGTSASFSSCRRSTTTDSSTVCSIAVLAHAVDVIIAAARCEREPSRLATLARHVALIRDDAFRSVSAKPDLGDSLARCETFAAVVLIDRCLGDDDRLDAERTNRA